MAKLRIRAGATEQTVYIFIQDSSATDGSGLAGLAFNSANLTAYYIRPLGTATVITLATQTVTGAYSSGGFVEVDGTNMPGVYRLDLPDAVIAAGVGSVVVMLKGATNMAPVLLEIQLDDMAEPTTVPAANASMEEKINWLYTLARNEIRQTATTQSLRNDANTDDIATSTTSDAAGTFTRGEWSP